VCPSCGSGRIDRRCELCDGEGRFELTVCARKFVTPEVWRTLHYANLWKEVGTAPVAGGVLDQAAVFADACELIWLLQQRFENEALERAMKRSKRGRR